MVKRMQHIGTFLHNEMGISWGGISPMCGHSSIHLQKIFFLRSIASALEACGWSVWWDRKIIPGQTFDQIIEDELNTAKSVVVLWSKNSISSEWVKNEATGAAARSALVPALIASVKPPLGFRHMQVADLVGWNGDPSHEGFQSLCDGVATRANTTGVPPRKPFLPKSRVNWNRHWTLVAIAATVLALGFVAYWGLRVTLHQPLTSPPSASSPSERHDNDNAAKATTPTIPLVSMQFTNLISSGSDIKEVKAFVNQNKAILNGVPQYGAYGELLEDISDFPINDTLKPDFTRFIFQPHFSQMSNNIIFIDFMSPQASIFETGSQLSEVAKSAKARMELYISTARANYKDYTTRVVQLQNFNIPLVRLQSEGISFFGDNDLKGDFPITLNGVIVIGRRKLLSGGQLTYLAKINENSRIRIITYDYIVEFLKEEERKTKAQTPNNADGGNKKM